MNRSLNFFPKYPKVQFVDGPAPPGGDDTRLQLAWTTNAITHLHFQVQMLRATSDRTFSTSNVRACVDGSAFHVKGMLRTPCFCMRSDKSEYFV